MKKICDKCGKEVEVLEEGEKPLEIKDVLPLTPEEEADLTHEKRVEEAEDRDRAIQASNEE